MNVIANSCVGAFLYEINNQQFSNPFMWTMTRCESMIQLMRHFNEINWAKIQLCPHYQGREDGVNYFSLLIDTLVEIHFTHYLWKDVDHQIVGRDIYDRHIYRYIMDKYFTRVRRMIANKEPPVFMVVDEFPGNYDYHYDNTKRLLQTDCIYQRIVITKHEDLLSYNNDKTTVIFDNAPRNQAGGKWTEDFAREYSPVVLDKIQLQST